MLRALFSYFKRMPRADPVIFVIGCTGTGKSDLGVAIAKKYNGEIISADSMQIYKGLDIATNKITEEEMESIPHHMMSFVEASRGGFHVHEFRQRGLKLIEEIRSRGCVPVIVGGTTYYVESLLFEDNFIHTEKSSSVDNSDLDSMTNDELYATLTKVDEESARLVHPNNRARVRRAIEIFRLTGKRKSEHLEEQKANNGGAGVAGRLRFDNSLVISLDADLEVLDERLDSRVEKMEKLGLRADLADFYDQYRESLESTTHGVLQCIGLKEFVPYLRLSPEERTTRKGDKLFAKGCDDVKLHTRQYSRKQRNWVNSRLVKRAEKRQLPSLKKLDTSDKHTILSNGLEVVDRWMAGEDFVEQMEGKDAESSCDANSTTHCDVCDIIVTGKRNWVAHLAGKRHRNQIRREVRLRENAGITVLSSTENQGEAAGKGQPAGSGVWEEQLEQPSETLKRSCVEDSDETVCSKRKC